jgi:hypothetical protein
MDGGKASYSGEKEMTKDEILDLAKECNVPTSFSEINLSNCNIEIEILQFARLIAEKEFKSGFLAGWYESGEGFNSECGCSIRTVLEMCNEEFKRREQQ